MPNLTDNDFETKITLESEANALPDDMPFRLLLMGDWSGRGNRDDLQSGNYRPLEIDRDNFEEVMRKLRVELSLDLHGDGSGNILPLHFEEIDDFHPDKIFHQVSLFADLRETRKRLLNPQTFNQAAREVRVWMDDSKKQEDLRENEVSSSSTENLSSAPPKDAGNLLDQILFKSAGDNAAVADRPAKPQSQPTFSKGLNELLGKLVRPFIVETDEAEQSKLVDAVDRATGELMRLILHHPQFQALESVWRGAYLLISRVETDSELKIYLLDIAKDELQVDIKSVGNLKDSAFYKLLVEKTAGAFGNDESWAAVCANYSFKSDVDDIAALMRIAEACAAADTPFIAQANSAILGVESIADAPDSDDWRIAEDAPEAKLWAMLRGLDESSYLGLTVPGFLARLPYGAKSEPTERFSFEELAVPAEHNQYLWANSSFACALLLAQSFRASGWEMGQGLFQDINNLPMHIYKEDGETKVKPCAETFMTQKAAEKILEHGLMPLVSFRDSDRVRLVRFQSIAFPPKALQGKWT